MTWRLGITALILLSSCNGDDLSGGFSCGNAENRCEGSEACFSVAPCDDAGWCPFFCAAPDSTVDELISQGGLRTSDAGTGACVGGDIIPLCCDADETFCVRSDCGAGDWCPIVCCPL